jgi:GNAT superfamily N-acetyltransferase
MRPEKSFTIMEATETDIPAVHAMIRELAEFENLAQELAVTMPLLHDALFGTRPAAKALIARSADAVAGYAVYYRTFSTFTGRPGIFLDDVYVRPAFRNQGLGRALMQHVACAEKGDNPARYEWIALNWNANALRFYRNLGARALDEWGVVRMSGEPLRRLMEEES